MPVRRARTYQADITAWSRTLKHALRHIFQWWARTCKSAVFASSPAFHTGMFISHHQMISWAKIGHSYYSWAKHVDLPSRSPSWTTGWDWSWGATGSGCSLLSVLAFRSHTSTADSYKKCTRLAFGQTAAVVSSSSIITHKGLIHALAFRVHLYPVWRKKTWLEMD